MAGSKTTRKSKYNAKRTEYNGVMYDSQKEAGFAKKLDLLKMASGDNRVLKVERQHVFSIDINDKHICKYICDFKVTYANDKVEYIDVKGMKSGAAYQMFKLKKKLVEATHDVKILEA